MVSVGQFLIDEINQMIGTNSIDCISKDTRTLNHPNTYLFVCKIDIIWNQFSNNKFLYVLFQKRMTAFEVSMSACNRLHQSDTRFLFFINRSIISDNKNSQAKLIKN